MARGRVMRIKYENRDVGFLGARLEEDPSVHGGWRLQVQSPANLEEFRYSLSQARSIALSLYVSDGAWYAGQASVAFLTEDDLYPMVTLSGHGPLRRA